MNSFSFFLVIFVVLNLQVAKLMAFPASEDLSQDPRDMDQITNTVFDLRALQSALQKSQVNTKSRSKRLENDDDDDFDCDCDEEYDDEYIEEYCDCD
uniref:U-scoloptoxin(06)-Sm1a n=1 Tax=Scolopendra morsitans TaxID=943129 RepID=TX61A_SCOMO|nr:RecName: Full=U-scoloptoxin(06)-Sm1a; Short=U-SLPTX(06)-Sm1a; Flags: Precursor [Scolopendra morsitans]